MTVILLGDAKDPHIEALAGKISDVYVLDGRRFPRELRLGFRVDNMSASRIVDTGTGASVEVGNVSALFWRTFWGGGPLAAQGKAGMFMANEIETTMFSFLQSLPFPCINPPQAIQNHRHKVHQTHLMVEHGFPVPRTLVTNHGESLQAFFEECGGEVVFKAVAGGGEVKKMTSADLGAERLAKLSNLPVQFQQYIAGTDIMAYRVGDDWFAAEVISEAVDFRKDPNRTLKPVTLPAKVASRCMKLCKQFQQVFSLVDLRRTPEGEYVFIEANPSPAFLEFEGKTGHPISGALVSLLRQGS